MFFTSTFFCVTDTIGSSCIKIHFFHLLQLFSASPTHQTTMLRTANVNSLMLSTSCHNDWSTIFFFRPSTLVQSNHRPIDHHAFVHRPSFNRTIVQSTIAHHNFLPQLFSPFNRVIQSTYCPIDFQSSFRFSIIA